MTRDEFNSFCAALPSTTHVVQWGNADVWKLGGKVFAIGGWNAGEDAFTFKVSDLGFEVLSDMPGLRPAPYMASRGLKWVQHFGPPGLSDAALEDHLRASYDMIAAALPKKTRAALGLTIVAKESGA
ncbi:MmcQ/YjbR family DNA-binding protein [Thalassovita taeanensis]|uniref:Predicted DNA-binding protein, MmcQ/YjbR family n=1 Tax=Thalassovita taeanensis TaxID=657014 RepID=A0A1H9FJG3_9RHOB|nr:MmcQ/YjbR family DNA-binding protein [Thalassovita taeanensis]SEQ38110.1 Predicted DNA-binding protein, MmcQ/YjbR family [Thalassovita taeanensis]